MSASIAVLLPLFVLMWIGTRRLAPDESRENYYKMSRSASISTYQHTTVGYSLQVAVTAYFVYWGYQHGWSNLWYLLSWAIGIYLYSLAASRLVSILPTHATLSAFIAAASGRRVRKVIALLTLLSLCALLYAEFFFTAHLVSSNGSGIDDATTYWTTFLSVLVACLAYTGLGGARRVVESDALHLAVAYAGIAPVFAYLLWHSGEQSRGFVLVLGIPLAVCFGTLAFVSRGNARDSMPRRAATASFILLVITALGSIWLSDAPFSMSSVSGNTPGGLFHQAATPWGFVPLIGFSVSNLLWQFSDYTAYQRLTLLELPRDPGDASRLLRASVLSTMFASPLTWGLGILLGMSIRTMNLGRTGGSGSNLDTLGRLMEFLQNDSTVFGVVAFVGLGIFITAVLFSTVDNTFLAIAELVEYDLLQRELPLRARFSILLAVAIVLVFFALLHVCLHFDILIFLSGVYSLTLVIAPIAIIAMFSRRLREATTVVSLVLGASLGGILGITSLPLPHEVLMVLPSLAAVATTAAISMSGVRPRSSSRGARNGQ